MNAVVLGVLAGAGAGTGLWVAYDAASPARPSLADALALLDGPRDDSGVDAGQNPRPHRHVEPLTRLLTRVGLGVPGRLRPDLALCERDPARHLADRTVVALAGLLVVPVLTLLAAPAGRALPAAVWWAVPPLAAAGFVGPDLAVLARARRRRRDWRHALSGFVDLAVIALAGGAGVEQALTHAAATGRGPEFTALRHALDQARLTRQPPWTHLAALGDRLGLAELADLAASVTLAGTNGAKVRASLDAKAASLRAHLLADTEADAASATERMSIPVLVMFAGFLLFLAYPSLTKVLTGL